IGAGLMLRSLLRLNGVDPGLDPKNVLTMEIPLRSVNYSDPTKIRTFYRQLVDRVTTVPGVNSAAVSVDLPLSGDDSELPFWPGNRPRPTPEEMSWALFYPVSPGYLDVLGIRLLKGRFFNERDTEKAATVAVVDELLARGLFPNEDPLGKRLTIEGIG